MNDIDPARLMTVGEVAGLLGLSERQVWKLNTSGKLPAPVRIGRSVRWRRQELLDWIEAGTPAREAWEKIRPGAAAARKPIVSFDARRNAC